MVPVSAAAGTISIVDADPEVRDLLPASDYERARRETQTTLRRLSTGDWDVASAEEPDSHHRGFLIVDGLISREVEVLGRRVHGPQRPHTRLRPSGGRLVPVLAAPRPRISWRLRRVIAR